VVDRVIGVKIDAAGARRGARQVRAALEDIGRTGRQTTTRLKGLKDALFSLKGAFAGLGIGLVGRELVQTANNLQRVERGLKVATGSVEGAAQEMAFLAEQTDRLGLNLESAEGSFVKLAAAAKGTSLEGEESRQVFLGVAEASAALGLNAEQTGGALTAIEQIISKGTVSAEELRGQLGERLPGAFQTAARAVGVTTEELGKLLQQGKLASEDFIPLFARQLRVEFGGAAEEAADSLQGSINKMSNAWLQLKRTLATSGALDPIEDAIKAITRLLEDEDFLEGAEKAAAALGKTLKFLAENIDLVVIALQGLVVGKIAGVFTNLGVGAFTLAVNLSKAKRAAIATAAATQGLAKASRFAAVGMTALRGVGMALGGPVGILVGIATAAALIIAKFRGAKKETQEFRERLDELGKTGSQLAGDQLRKDIEETTDFLEDANKRLADATRARDEENARRQEAGDRGNVIVSLVGETRSMKEAKDDIAAAEAALERLRQKQEDTGDASNDLQADLEALRAGLNLTGGNTDEAAKDIEKARESLQGMIDGLTEANDTFGQSESEILAYRLTTGDLSDEVAALGVEGEELAKTLIDLSKAYEGNERAADAAREAQSTFADLYENTRTSAEAYADELERLDLLYAQLVSSGELTEEQLEQLPEIFDRLREAAAKSAEDVEEPFDAMTEFATAAARSMQSAMSDLFFSVMQGEFDDLASNFKSTIDRMVADFLASQLLNFIAQAGASSGNPLLQAFGTVVAGAKQEGGSVQRGRTFLVGERGPEIFEPTENGRIVPNRTLQRTPGLGGIGGDVAMGQINAQDAQFSRFGRELGRFAGDIGEPRTPGQTAPGDFSNIFGRDPSLRMGQPEGITVTDYASRSIEQGAGFQRQPNTEFRQNISLGLGGVDGKILEGPGSGSTGFNRFAGRAGGGSVMRGQAIVAGENGPELFVGAGGGGGGGGGAVVNMTVNTPNADSFRQSQTQVLSEMNRLLQGARIRNG
jgi:tape measure domain-containing protein